MVVTILLVACGTVLATDAVYLAFLASAALFLSNEAAPGLNAQSHLTVLVPAHNETDFICRCIDSLHVQDYPRDLYRIVVIADNCTDDTATVARSAGAEVMVRDAPGATGKGHALRWALDQLFARSCLPDAVVFVDADSIAEPQLLSALATRLESGAEAVQGEYLSLPEGGSARSELRAGAFLLFNRVRPAGRAAVGLPCGLVGNGMLVSRRLLERLPWSAFSSVEDLEYSIDLRLAGVAPVFGVGAVIRGPLATRGHAARTQRLRWLGGRFDLVRRRLPEMLSTALRRRDLSLLDAAFELSIPPLGLLGALVAAGTAAVCVLMGTGVSPSWALTPWCLAASAVAFFVLAGLRAGGAPATTYRALWRAPGFVCSELLDSLRLFGRHHATTWHRTERPSDKRRGDLVRSEICGVPVDSVDMNEALGRAMSAVATQSFVQVCTVNLDFLVHAQRDRSVRAILQQARLNLADGKPVVWLGRLIGAPIPGRLAGADFVMKLLEAAGARGSRVFLFGGEGGAADLAAQRLIERYPELRIVGIYEPARGEPDEFDDEIILARIRESRADILLVALGHPKQEKWIYRQRHELPTPLAVGVGCTFDLIARRQRRAPLWMQQAGLEWFYRLAHEPVRLFPRYASDACWLAGVLLPVALRQRALGRRL